MIDILSQQGLFPRYPSAKAVVTEHSYIMPNGAALGRSTTPFQTIPESAYTPWIPHENALGLSGMNAPESVWVAGPSAYPSATSTSNWQTDAQLLNMSLLHQLSPPDNVLRLLQIPADQFPSVREETALFGVGGNPIVQPFHNIALPGGVPTQKPTTHSPGRRISVSQSLYQYTPPRPPRYTPYPIAPLTGRMRQRILPTPVYLCQWLVGTSSCGATVTGTKNGIQRHLQDAHGVRTRADKTDEVCQWDKCGRPMRRESIARHILAVHMEDKVPCPSCGSCFARTDSLQRHRRTQCLVKGGLGGPDAGKAAV